MTIREDVASVPVTVASYTPEGFEILIHRDHNITHNIHVLSIDSKASHHKVMTSKLFAFTGPRPGCPDDTHRLSPCRTQGHASPGFDTHLLQSPRRRLRECLLENVRTVSETCSIGFARTSAHLNRMELLIDTPDGSMACGCDVHIVQRRVT